MQAGPDTMNTPSISSEHTVEVRLPLDVAVELAHGVVAQTLVDVGGRGLFFKGPIAHGMNLRVRNRSSDVDVLIEPGGEDAVVQALAAHGWRDRPSGGDLGVGLVHARTLLHDGWPVDIDLHRRVPGIEADPEEAFERLWEERDALEIAHVPVPVPSRIAHAMLLMLNGLRTPWEKRAQRELTHLASVLDVDDWHALNDLAQTLDAARALSSFFAEQAPESITPDLGPASHEWLLYQHLEHPTVLWLDAIRRAPLRHWPRLLWHAAFPSAELLVKRDLSLENASRVHRMKARTARWKKFLRNLPQIMRAASHLRQESKRTAG